MSEHNQPCAYVLHAAERAETAGRMAMQHAIDLQGVHAKLDRLVRSAKHTPLVVGAIVAFGTAAIGAISQLQVATISARTVDSSRATGEQLGRLEAARDRFEKERQDWQRMLADHRDCVRASR